MEITYTHAAGLDVHKQTVVACCFTPGPQGKPQKEIRTFGMMTRDLLALVDWLTARGIRHVAMESTGEFWKPISTTCPKQRLHDASLLRRCARLPCLHQLRRLAAFRSAPGARSPSTAPHAHLSPRKRPVRNH